MHYVTSLGTEHSSWATGSDLEAEKLGEKRERVNIGERLGRNRSETETLQLHVFLGGKIYTKGRISIVTIEALCIVIGAHSFHVRMKTA